MTDTYTPNPDVSIWTMAAVALCEHACGYQAGRTKLDPVYVEVTEGRDGPTPAARAHYSSCGDLAHWLLERLGVRASWVNRKSLGHYTIGMNIGSLYGCPIAHVPNAPPAPGDICEIWNATDSHDAHVCIVLGPGSDDKHLRIANYGAGGMSSATAPGCNISDSPLARDAYGWHIGKNARKLQRVIRLVDVVPLITARPVLTGAPVADDLVEALRAIYVGEGDP